MRRTGSNQLSEIVGKHDHSNKAALLSFILAAQTGRLASAKKLEKAAFRLASLLHELEVDLISLPEAEMEGFIALLRLSAGLPVWDDKKIWVSMLISAAVTTRDVTGDEYHQTTSDLPRWKRVQIYEMELTQGLTQLVDEICDPGSAAIGGKTRKNLMRNPPPTPEGHSKYRSPSLATNKSTKENEP